MNAEGERVKERENRDDVLWPGTIISHRGQCMSVWRTKMLMKET